jgi:hypothetical protein
MKVWITKWAMTTGIIETECEMVGDYILYKHDEWFHTSIKIGSGAYLTFEEAQAKAEKMRKTKIASLKKQILNISAIDFCSAHERASKA